MQRKHMIGIAIGAAALVLLTAGASAVVINDMIQEDSAPTHESVQTRHPVSTSSGNNVTWNSERTAPPPAPQQEACDDGNLVGKVLGGAAGGVAGSQVGSGSGKTAATIGGTLGGALLGGEYLPTKNVTCPR